MKAGHSNAPTIERKVTDKIVPNFDIPTVDRNSAALNVWLSEKITDINIPQIM
jgi:hypothetical protein